MISFIIISSFLVQLGSGQSNPCKGIVEDFLPVFGDCSKYITCFKEVAYYNNCPKDFFFDETKKVCIAQKPTRCYCENDPKGIYGVGLVNTCKKYILCVYGSGLEMECGPGMEFDEDAGDCVLEENSSCFLNPCPQNNSSGLIEIHKHPKDCFKYIICSKGDAIERLCASGSVFDPNTLQCARGDECIEENTTTEPTTSTTEEVTLETTPETTTPEETTTEETTPEESTPEETTPEKTTPQVTTTEETTTEETTTEETTLEETTTEETTTEETTTEETNPEETTTKDTTTEDTTTEDTTTEDTIPEKSTTEETISDEENLFVLKNILRIIHKQLN